MVFDHIAIESKDIQADVDFYRSRFSKIGILYQDETWAFLDLGGMKLALVTPGQHPPHIAYREILEKLASESNATIKVHRDKSESFYLYDPSGNASEVVFYPEKN
jgi:extradiol dioxygenase family protein